MKSILNLIRDIKEEYQLTERTHLMGFSQGGILSYSMALTYPELFNKIAILSAYPETKILQNISKDKSIHRNAFLYFPRNGGCCNPFGYGESGGRYVV